MVAPAAYARLNAYTDWSVNNPGDPHPGPDFDEDFDALASFSQQLLDHLALTIRSDSKLADGVIDSDDAFTPEYLADLRSSIAGLASSGLQGPAGPQGLLGPRGTPGPAGPPLPWIVSTGVPSANIGIATQLFLNADNGDVYQKGANGWLALANIKGPAGSGSGGGGTSDHGTLTGLADPDHPISAVSGLQDALTSLQTAIAATGLAAKNVYSQPNSPTTLLNAGDLWFDTDNGNRLLRWNGASWIDVSDARINTAVADAAAAITQAAGAQATADGKVTTFFGSSSPVNPRLGDLWFRTDLENQMFRYSGSAWVSAQDQGIGQAIQLAADAQSTADGKIESYYQPTAPIGASLGDIWIDTDDANHPYRFNGAQWLSIRDATIAQAAAAAAAAVTTASEALTTASAIGDNVVEVFYQNDPPAVPTPDVGDLWIDTNAGNLLHRWNGSSWVAIQDAGIQSALTNASLAQATADGKIRIFYQNTAPSVGVSTGDMWVDLDDANRPYRYNGSTWIDVTPVSGVVGGLITGVSIANGVITANKLVANTITAASGVIANAAITNAMIADAAITSAKIGNLQVGTAQIQDGAINTAKLGTVAITNAMIQDAAITNAKIQNLTIDTQKIATGAITQSVSARATSVLALGSDINVGANVLSASITTGGGRVHVFYGAAFENTSGFFRDVTMRLRRGTSTVLETITIRLPATSTQYFGTVVFDEVLPAGSYTFYLDASHEIASGNVINRHLMVLEAKK